MRRGPRNGDRSVVGIRVAAAVLAGKRDKRQKCGSDNDVDEVDEAPRI